MANEKRLIDANDAQERMCAVCKNAFPGPCHPDYCNFVDAISDSKTVDAVEVVRCKYCKYWHDTWLAPDGTHEHGYCHMEESDEVIVPRWDDDFCSYGERK